MHTLLPAGRPGSRNVRTIPASEINVTGFGDGREYLIGLPSHKHIARPEDDWLSV